MYRGVWVCSVLGQQQVLFTTLPGKTSQLFLVRGSPKYWPLAFRGIWRQNVTAYMVGKYSRAQKSYQCSDPHRSLWEMKGRKTEKKVFILKRTIPFFSVYEITNRIWKLWGEKTILFSLTFFFKVLTDIQTCATALVATCWESRCANPCTMGHPTQAFHSCIFDWKQCFRFQQI